MKMSGNRLKLSSGKIVKFGSAKKRENFERVAEAYKHGWRPPKMTGKERYQKRGA